MTVTLEQRGISTLMENGQPLPEGVFGGGHVQITDKSVSEPAPYPKENQKLAGRRQTAHQGEIIIGEIQQMQTDINRAAEHTAHSQNASIEGTVAHTVYLQQREQRPLQRLVARARKAGFLRRSARA